MIELFFVLRIFSDYFWEFKLVSAIVALVFPIVFMLYIFNTRRFFGVYFVDFLLFTFLAIACIADFLSAKASSPDELYKFIAFFFSYLAGRIINVQFSCSQIFSLFCVLFLMVFFVASLLGLGYETWGEVSVFSGGYFFKTDMAISVIIMLSFVLVFSNNRFFLYLSILISGYLVFITNARIALPLVIVVPMLAIAIRKGWVRDFKGKAIFYSVATMFLGFFGLYLVNMIGVNMLGFDFSDPFSGANTQGRTLIWSTILSFYFEASMVEQLFGLGLGADSYATSLLADHPLAGVRAHNSFVYLLVCTGLVGLITIFWFLLLVVLRVPLLLGSKNVQFFRVASLTVIFVFVMFWFSLSTEVIIRPQLMILVFFLCGLTVQAYSLERKLLNGQR